MQIDTGTPLLAPQLTKSSGQTAQQQTPAAAFEPVEFPAAAAAKPEQAAAGPARIPARPLPPGSKIDIRV